MKVSKNAYYYWLKKNSITKENTPKMLLKERIMVLFNESRAIYGSYRIHIKLEREGIFYSRSYIGLLMKEMGLKSVLRKKFVSTTDSNHSYPVVDNILNRKFNTTSIGAKWVSDITYIRVNDQWNYFTTILDLADRKVVGWSLSEDMTVENTIYRAWLSAKNTREIVDGFIFHSDRGHNGIGYNMPLIK